MVGDRQRFTDFIFHQPHSGKAVIDLLSRAVWGINGRYLGPTIRVWKGDDVKLIYSNRLTENVSMTVAGLQ
ncbi:multicopper oxidase domain-containing protein, partial [Escherichia coli]|uniref:multicopper oxidase domain-containing protein n=1 Tax=Escherichia coli TaxID=562 RepID=UPI003EE22EE2